MIPMKVGHGGDIAEVMDDRAWAFQQKMDGARAIADVRPDGVTWTANGGGAFKFAAGLLALPAIEAELVERLGPWSGVTLDGEVMPDSGVYHVFDVLAIVSGDGTVRDYREHPWEERYAAASVFALLALPRSEDARVRLVPAAFSADAKRALWADVNAAGAEGVIAKRLDGTYEYGARSMAQRKYKITKTADVIVTATVRGRNAGTGRETGSATLAAYALGSAADAPIAVGKCSLIGKGEVHAGDVIEVEYLYWTGAAMVQPRMKRRRDDKRPEECDMEQFATYSRAPVRAEKEDTDGR